ncbi:hypothetical protein K440DRAFT_615929 [Wilcoxina mikolae CBS 423.85]|nr:hypothetical protein K440DRAFT_615929 [Wilcoxina mikolae CBS 423.85]
MPEIGRMNEAAKQPKGARILRVSGWSLFVLHINTLAAVFLCLWEYFKAGHVGAPWGG